MLFIWPPCRSIERSDIDSGRTGGGGMVVLYIERGVMVDGGR